MRTTDYKRGFQDAKRKAESFIRTWRRTLRGQKFDANKALKGLAYDLRHDLVIEG